MLNIPGAGGQVARLYVSIGADLVGLNKGLKDADKAVNGFGSGVANTFKSIGGNVTQAGKQVTKFVSGPAAGMLAASTAIAIKWESDFAGVRKTVDATDAEFKELDNDLRSIARRSPIPHEDIAKIAELAGQLGIAKEEIPAFTETIAKMAVSTDLSAETAAMALARIINVTKAVAPAGMTAADQAQHLGSVIVDLGNKMATTESEIVNMANRMAGTFAMVGVGQDEIMGWAAAFSSLGIRAEAGGTAASTAMKKMFAAVQTGGAGLETFADVSGMTTTELQELFKADPSKAFLAFITGFGKIQAEGGNTISILDELGLSGIRVSELIQKAAGNPELVAQALGIANEAWEENNALNEEARKRFATTASQLVILKNNIRDLAITLGSVLLPIFNDVLKVVLPLVQRFAKFADENPAVAKTIVLVAAALAALGPALIIAGQLISSVGTIIGALSGIAGFVSSIVGGIGGIAGAIAAFNPVALAVIAVLAALYLAWKTNFLGIRDIVAEVWEGLKYTFRQIGGIVKAFFQFLAGEKDWKYVQDVWAGAMLNIKAKWAEAWANIKSIFTSQDIVAWADEVATGLKSKLSGLLEKVVGGVIGDEAKTQSTVQAAVQNVLTGIGTAIDFVRSLVENKMAALRGMFVFGVQLLAGDWGGAWETLKTTVGGWVSGIFESILGIIGVFSPKLADRIRLIAEGWKAGFQTLFGGDLLASVRTFVGEVVTKADELTTKIETIVGNLSTWVGNVATAIGTALGHIGDFFVTVWSKVTGLWGAITGGGRAEEAEQETGGIAGAWQSLKSAASVFDEIVGIITGAWETIWTTVSTKTAEILTNVQTFYRSVVADTETNTAAMLLQWTETWASIQAEQASSTATIRASFAQHMAEMRATSTLQNLAILAESAAVWGSIAETVAEKARVMRVLGVSQVQALKDQSKTLLDQLVADAGNAGKGLARAFGDSVRGEMGNALNAVKQMADEMRSYLPGSDAEKGPLSDITKAGKALPGTLAQGMMQGARAVQSTMDDILSPSAKGAKIPTLPGQRTTGDQLEMAGLRGFLTSVRKFTIPEKGQPDISLSDAKVPPQFYDAPKAATEAAQSVGAAVQRLQSAIARDGARGEQGGGRGGTGQPVWVTNTPLPVQIVAGAAEKAAEQAQKTMAEAATKLSEAVRPKSTAPALDPALQALRKFTVPKKGLPTIGLSGVKAPPKHYDDGSTPSLWKQYASGIAPSPWTAPTPTGPEPAPSITKEPSPSPMQLSIQVNNPRGETTEQSVERTVRKLRALGHLGSSELGA